MNKRRLLNIVLVLGFVVFLVYWVLTGHNLYNDVIPMSDQR